MTTEAVTVKYAFILNPTAGCGHAVPVMEQIQKVLQERELSFDVLRTEYPGHATEIARKLASDPEVKAVAAVGGDGTVSEVAAGITGTEKPMGVIPAGTGNDFIKSVSIPKEPLAALDCFLKGNVRETDTGSVNGDGFFLNVCGTGFDVTVLDYTERYKSRFRGLTPYLLGLNQSIFHYEPVKLTLTVDGKQETGEYLICAIANGRIIGGGIPICPAADPRDGKLDLVLIENVPRWRIPLYLPGLMMSRDLTFGITRHVLADEVTLEGKNMRVNVDGDVRPMEKGTFKIHPGSLKLIC